MPATPRLSISATVARFFIGTLWNEILDCTLFNVKERGGKRRKEEEQRSFDSTQPQTPSLPAPVAALNRAGCEAGRRRASVMKPISAQQAASYPRIPRTRLFLWKLEAASMPIRGLLIGVSQREDLRLSEGRTA